jgi:hypothetical protein
MNDTGTKKSTDGAGDAGPCLRGWHERRFRPWHYAAGILLFPFGLIGLLFAKCGRCRAWVRPTGLLLFLVGLAQICGGGAVVAVIQDRRENAPLEAVYERAKGSLREDRVAEPYLRGKVLVLSGDTGMAHSLQRSLPPAVRADKPDEVNTVVVLTRRTEKGGSFGSWLVSTGKKPGRIVHRRKLDIRIVDLRRGAVIHDHTLTGEMPSRVRLGAMVVSSSKPADEEALEYLLKLPRRSLDQGGDAAPR